MVETWPDLATPNWQATALTIHMWSQIVGKTRLRLATAQNHWWHVALYVTPIGLTTSVIETGDRAFEIEFDLVGHALRIRDERGRTPSFPLEPMPVADFYRRFLEAMRSIDIEVRIFRRPVECVEAIPFDQDQVHRSYDRVWAERLHAVHLASDGILKKFRGEFRGKASPVHFFWGGFDLAATRFSGRTAPPHPGGVPNVGDWVMREAYSHEVSSAGFWPGAGYYPEAVFYAYAYPQPDGFERARIRPATARWDTTLREFVLPYDAVRRSSDPAGDVRAFLDSTYEAGADAAGWDRRALERQEPRP